MAHERSRLLRFVLAATLLPLAAFLTQLSIWPILSPHAWDLLFPTVFLAAWLGGSAAGIGATLLSGLLIWWRFVPPEGTLLKDSPNNLLPAAIFIAMGLVLSMLQGRLRRANQARAAALADSERSNSQLKGLLSQNAIFTALIENTSDFIGIADPEGTLIYVNPAGRRMVGLAPDFPVAETRAFSDYYPPEQRAFASDVIAKKLRESGRWAGETCFRHWQTDEAIPVSDAHFTIREPGTGRVLGFGTIARDISEIKRTRDELEAANRKRQELDAQISGIVAIAADAIISADETGRIKLFNEGAQQKFGYRRDEMLGASIEQLMPERFRATHGQHFARFAAGPEQTRRMREGKGVFGLRKDGTEFPADATIVKLQLNGAMTLTIALRDITREKPVSEAGAVAASSLDYDQLLSGLARLAVRDFADVCTVDVFEDTGEIERLYMVSRDPTLEWACEILRETPPDRARSHPVWSNLDPERPLLIESLSPEVAATFAQNNPERLRAIKAIAPRSILSVPLVAPGRVIGLLSLVSSTPRRYGADDVPVAEALAVRITYAIENARLYSTAQRALKARDEMMGIVAHDLRNPLQSIALESEVLDRQTKQKSQRTPESVVAIKRTATRMNRMIQDLLDTACVETGQLRVEQHRESPADLVSEAAQTESPVASSKSLELQTEVAEGLPEVWADRDRIVQVFENLVSNALRFTPPGGRITLGATIGAAEVVFSVADTGAGIPADELPHVFDRFWRTRENGLGGAGLGLPVVKGIVEAHGGHIWVQSTPQRGTTFFFTVPVARYREADFEQVKT